jgi:hypothetical protein
VDDRDLVIQDAVEEAVRLREDLTLVVDELAEQTYQAILYQRLATQFLRELVLERVRFSEQQRQIAGLLGVA